MFGSSFFCRITSRVFSLLKDSVRESFVYRKSGDANRVALGIKLRYVGLALLAITLSRSGLLFRMHLGYTLSLDPFFYGLMLISILLLIAPSRLGKTVENSLIIRLLIG